MSPVPPPPGTIIPSDDWTDDPSFDLSPSAAHHFALPPSSPSSSSTSSKSRQSLQSIRAHASSPLRQSFSGVGVGVGSGSASGVGSGSGGASASGMGTIKAPPLALARRDDVEDDDGMDFDLPDSFPAFASPRNSMASTPGAGSSSRPRSSTASSSSSSIRNLSHTVVGAGPKGVGTITRLGAPPKAANGLPVGTVRARARALEQAWEMDVDFGPGLEVDHSAPATVSIRKGSRLTLSPPRRGFMPPADALDDLGFSDDEDQATLKAGATIKAMLPPPRPKLNSTSVSKADIPPTAAITQTPPEQDPGADDEDEDFAIPLNLTNLTLATQPPMPKLSRHRQSNASTSQSHADWDSPGTSTSGKKSTGFWGSEDSPRGKTSETSATSASLSDGLGPSRGAGVKRDASVKPSPSGQDEVDEEDDMESGLLLPSPTFFSNQRAKELNSILDRKRKPQFAPPPPPPAHSRGGTDDTLRTADESMEDGLVFDNPRVELSNHRLRHNRRTRNQTVTPTAQTPRRGSGGTKSVAKEREKAWEKQREQGWGRHTPLPTHTRERTQSTLGLSGLRSHSASATAALKDFTPSYQRPESPLVFSRERDTPRASSRTQTQTFMPPPPVPPPQAAATPASGSRLRHQKSQYHLPPPQSPSLARKQSLASLQDAMSHHPHPHPPPVPELPASIDPPPPSTSRYHASTSRLTLPTSSSRAKQRPPISSVFPHPERPGRSDFASGSSASWEQQTMTPVPRRTKTMEMPRRAKTWGDGTELEGIEDLMVEDDPRGSALGLGRPSRRGHEPSHTRVTPPKQSEEKRKKSGSGSVARRNRNRKPALLIRNLGAVDKKKVVGDMTWNPQTLRWEGNESVLRDFDNINVASSARPALIAHYTGSSVGGVTSPSNGAGAGAAASTTIRIVGDMQFDPERMCWVSLADEEEPDPFEGMADDEDEESGRGGGSGATITRALGRKLVSVGLSSSGTTTTSAGWSSRLASESGMSLAASSVMSWDDRGQAVPGPGPVAVSKDLWAECKEAEERHRKDVRGWIMRQPSGREEIRDRERKEEKRLWEIRNLAMKS